MNRKNRWRLPSKKSQNDIDKVILRSNQVEEETFAETTYLKGLIREKSQVIVKLLDNQGIKGRIEYYDKNFIRMTCKPLPNLFIYKKQIKYILEA